jgi:molybdopterin-binding protein
VRHFRVGQAAELLGVSSDTCRRWIDSGKLPATKTPAGHREVAGHDLAEFARQLVDGEAVGALTGRSTRNRFVGIVTAVKKDNVMAQVDLAAGRHRLVALLSREAVEELGLEPGELAMATTKATQIALETVDVP